MVLRSSTNIRFKQSDVTFYYCNPALTSKQPQALFSPYSNRIYPAFLFYYFGQILEATAFLVLFVGSVYPITSKQSELFKNPVLNLCFKCN